MNGERPPIRMGADTGQPVLVYLPGLHGDWTLAGLFRQALAGRVRLVELSYPTGGEWTLDRLAAVVVEELERHGIREGWLLGESFGSQVLWAAVRQGVFRARGLILAGGFVRHPCFWEVRAARALHRRVPRWMWRWTLEAFAAFAARRAPRDAEWRANLREFVDRRCTPADRLAILQRYDMILDNDLRPVARACRQPLFHLTGWIDPIVPWCGVRHWLRMNAPGLRASRVVRRADHAILGSAAVVAADQMVAWIRGAEAEAGSNEAPVGLVGERCPR